MLNVLVCTPPAPQFEQVDHADQLPTTQSTAQHSMLHERLDTGAIASTHEGERATDRVSTPPPH
jgi:hypothetical protein